MAGIELKTDFIDYYDYALLDNNDTQRIKYNRMLSESMPKGKALNFLKKMNIRTIDMQSVSKLSGSGNRLVIYTNPSLHQGSGKIICDVNEAMNNYSNYLASEYISDTDGMCLKHLFVGSRRFRVMLKYAKDSLSEYSVTSIDELPGELNYLIGEPIFSIDYIPINNEIVAVDYNSVQNLARIRLDTVMSPEDVKKEIINALVAYKRNGE